MIYQFICDACGEEKEISKGMNDPMPEVFCDVCRILMHRDYSGESKDKATIIPDHMRGINQMKPNFNYDKSPSGKKRFW